MNLEDKLAIQEVLTQFSYTWDAKDAEGFANLFTEDAVWEMVALGETSPHLRVESRTAIREWALRTHQGRPVGIQPRHYQSGLLFEELSSDAARTRTMLLLTHQDTMDAAPRLHRSGVFHCQWRKMHEGWKLVQCTLYHDDRK